MSSRASPGGLSALRTRCTRRSLLVTVPSDSHHAAAAGSTTCASSAVRVRKMSCTTIWSRLWSSRSARVPSASDCAGFSPMTYSVRSVPCSIASNISVRCQPRFAGSVAAVFPLELRAVRVVLDVLSADELVGNRAHVAAALHVVLAAQRDQPGSVAADMSRQEREVDDREHVVDRVVMFGDPKRPAHLRASGAGVGVRELADRRPPGRR